MDPYNIISLNEADFREGLIVLSQLFMKYCIYQSKSLLIWVLPNDEEQKEITHHEKIIAQELNDEKSKQFKYSRGYIRFFLSQLFKINPLEVELYANPGEAPELSSKFGYLSISHTYDALAISWSIYKVGIDIELSLIHI